MNIGMFGDMFEFSELILTCLRYVSKIIGPGCKPS